MKERKSPSVPRDAPGASSQTIGGLTRGVAQSAARKATTTTKLNGLPSNSPRTHGTRGASTETRSSLSGTGSSPAIRTGTSTSADVLAGLSTVAADKKLRDALPPSVVLRPVYGPSLEDHTPVAYRASGASDEAIAILEASLMPVDSATLERALTELSLLTKAREDDAATEDMRIALYMSRLSEYPADAVLHVCRSWADENVFWPSWAELRERLEARVRERHKMLDALI